MEGVCLHGPFCIRVSAAALFPPGAGRTASGTPAAAALSPAFVVDGFVQRQPKASATSASSAQSRRSILKYLSVETEIHASAEKQAANLVHQAKAHTQATAHWNSATHAAPQPERISRLTAAMAATQASTAA